MYLRYVPIPPPPKLPTKLPPMPAAREKVTHSRESPLQRKVTPEPLTPEPLTPEPLTPESPHSRGNPLQSHSLQSHSLTHSLPPKPGRQAYSQYSHSHSPATTPLPPLHPFHPSTSPNNACGKIQSLIILILRKREGKFNSNSKEKRL